MNGNYIEPMEFLKYDKISDDVYVLGPNTVLKFNVALSKITSEGKRYHYYKEFEYSSRAQGFPSLVTVKRSYDFYLSIENLQKNRLTDKKAFIRIGPADFYKFKGQLDTVFEWFTGKKYKGLFQYSRKELKLVNPVPESTVGGYPLDSFLRFIPAVIDKGNGSDRMLPGVELDLSSYDNYVLMTFERFMGLYSLMNNFNMYIAAQNMINIMGFPSGQGRVTIGEPGSRSFSFEDSTVGMTEGINERTINGKKNISALE